MMPPLVRRSIISLGGGVFLTLGLAWGSAAWIDLNPARPVATRLQSPHERWGAYCEVASCFGGVRHELQTVHHDADPAELVRMNSKMLSGWPPGAVPPAPCTIYWLPGWSQLAQVPEGWSSPVALEDSRGWPFKCLYYNGDSAYYWASRGRGPISPEDVQLQHGLLLQPWSSRPSVSFLDARVLPLKPIWFGLVANVAILSMVFFVIAFGSGQLKRWLRSRRGACLWCGYSLFGISSDRCPECGRLRGSYLRA